MFKGTNHHVVIVIRNRILLEIINAISHCAGMRSYASKLANTLIPVLIADPICHHDPCPCIRFQCILSNLTCFFSPVKQRENL
jgi:hypothetical protein